MTDSRQRRSGRWPALLGVGVAFACLAGVLAQAPSAAVSPPTSSPTLTNGVSIVSLEGPTGSVQVLRAGATVWEPAQPNQVLRPGGRIRSGEHGRVTLRWSDNGTSRLAPFSH